MLSARRGGGCYLRTHSYCLAKLCRKREELVSVNESRRFHGKQHRKAAKVRKAACSGMGGKRQSPLDPHASI